MPSTSATIVFEIERFIIVCVVITRGLGCSSMCHCPVIRRAGGPAQIAKVVREAEGTVRGGGERRGRIQRRRGRQRCPGAVQRRGALHVVLVSRNPKHLHRGHALGDGDGPGSSTRLTTDHVDVNSAGGRAAVTIALFTST